MRNPTANYLNALTIFLSALLLFQVEPLIGKVILPWFGGVAAVWTVCLLFFQVLLLLGYLYAHLLTQNFGRRAQGWIHAAVLGASLLALPILPRNSWKPTGPEHPALRILEVLVLAVGLPFFVLSATSPLLQAWWASTRKDAGVYRFYALSNAGSLLGLLTYPVLIEPRLTIPHQGWSWSFAYAAFAVACGAIAVAQGERTGAPLQKMTAAPPGWNTRAIWIALPACSSALLLATTNHITQNIATVPFLWVIPLSLYMLTFILCFGNRWYHRMLFLRALGVALGCMAYALSPSLTSLPLWILISLFCAGLFVCCMFCHGELARLKPDPSQLTSFYFWSSLGSVAGAVFVALLAPHIFSGFYELHVGLGACALLAVLVHRMDRASPFRQPNRRLALLVLYGLAATVMVSLFFLAHGESISSNRMARNFYGVLRVSDESAPNVVLLKGDEQQSRPKDDLRFRRLMNGTITHGIQFLGAARRDQPVSYYAPDSGIGIAFTALASRGPRRVGAIGLGTGTIAAYGRAGDELAFYEINPMVVQIAQHDFTFLRDSKAQISFELGDARLTLERQPPQHLDLLAVDAFSSDSIPVHLLTLEAFELYFRHLKPDGILAMHISNRHLYLEPVVAAAAEKLDKDAVLIESSPDRPNEIFLARWVLLADHGVLQQFTGIEEAGEPPESLARLKLWTDSYSSLFVVLK